MSLVTKHRGRGIWAVLDAAGARRSHDYSSAADAMLRADELNRLVKQRAQYPERLCLTCGEIFTSQGNHNRMCAGSITS